MEPTAKNPDPHHIFIDEVQGHQRRWLKVIQFTSSSTKAAAIMLAAAIVALVIANSPFFEPFEEFWHTHVVVGVGGFIGEMSLAHIINDIFMAVFFLLVGLEIKYEMTVGELTNIRQAILPVGAAIGGVAVPIIFYVAFNQGSPETLGGWGVPTATDIAFALGILALLGSRVPAGVRVFLSTLAVADDIIAIVVIAVFYGHAPSVLWLLAALVVLGALTALNRLHFYSLWPYVLLGVVLWYCVFMSGVHATIAGVLLAFTIPSGSRVDLLSFGRWSNKQLKEIRANFQPDAPVLGQSDYLKEVSHLARVAKEVVPPATRLERMLYPWVYFAILPLFALTNADVALGGTSFGAIVADPVFLGVFAGLLLGKPIGIFLFSFLIVKLKISSLPNNVNWAHIFGAALLGGVGFTMAIFVANLAFPEAVLIADAKIGILSASLLAGVIGFCSCSCRRRRPSARASRTCPPRWMRWCAKRPGKRPPTWPTTWFSAAATRIWSTMCARCWKPRAAWRSSSCTRSATRPRPRKPRTSPVRDPRGRVDPRAFRTFGGRSFGGALFHASSRFRKQQARYNAPMRSAMA